MKKKHLLLLTVLCTINPMEFAMGMSIESPDFTNNGMIPLQYSCNGGNSIPTMHWQDPPENTKSFVFIVDDPDAPSGLWTHWVLFNIPRDIRQLSEIPAGAINGKNSWGTTGYKGPCPPSGTHRYFFKLYALDTNLTLDENANEQDVLTAMQNHILDQSELVGLYASSDK